MSRRDEEKKRRRRKRLLKKQRRASDFFDNAHELAEPSTPFEFLRSLKKLVRLPEPRSWPGASDPALARPDRVKLAFAEWISTREPGRSRFEKLQKEFQKGLLSFLPEMDHWAMEEFFWHGFPGDSWHPIDAYLEAAGGEFSPAARAQLLGWKGAKVGIYEIGEVRDDLAELREWDVAANAPAGPWRRSIALNIGGVNYYRQYRGDFNLSYVAEWAPQEQLYCAMGYGTTAPAKEKARLLPYLGLRHPEIISRPLPWTASPGAVAEHLRRWRSRDWHSWLGERLQFPFSALIYLPPGNLQLCPVVRLLPSTPEQARNFGIYLEVPLEDDEVGAIGATAVTPVDVTSPNLAALREYDAYRDRVGPPPGTVGQPDRLRIR